MSSRLRCHRLLARMRQQPAGVELLDRYAAAAISNEIHGISPGLSNSSRFERSASRPVLPHAEFEDGEIDGAQQSARRDHDVGGGNRIPRHRRELLAGLAARGINAGRPRRSAPATRRPPRDRACRRRCCARARRRAALPPPKRHSRPATPRLCTAPCTRTAAADFAAVLATALAAVLARALASGRAPRRRHKRPLPFARSCISSASSCGR